MAIKRIGTQTIKFVNPPLLISTASIVGPKEGEGPLGEYFDKVLSDDLFQEVSWEKAESKMTKEAISLATNKAQLKIPDIQYLLGGDLLNQLIATTYAARDLQIPFLGLYGACSTMAESLALGGILIDGGFADRVVAATSSHFSSAERQFRFPLELGNQRPLTAQWTVTGAGAVILSEKGKGPTITHVTTGKVLDYGIADASNMGAAMAPAAASTIVSHFSDTGFKPEDYDLIITGDLGIYGGEIAIELVRNRGLDIMKNYSDCGIEIFNGKKQDTHAGGSGCGCSAVVFCGYLYKKLVEKKYRKILLVSTGALFSPLSLQQGESIPSIAHAVTIECN
ncbi:stage V sporulation protein AD [Alkaliphilus serpentinus]|uniref:Stage V sporulation protein AD n=1 Tax=Alkaliphilus serpentinus TaxID=1482731 RepID=A0A833HQ43_9FIRM|nr:stage V sporulation protein AD [Alkaliphilus serpentinus]KAB3531477.1 stage V sporulation protein AD [Alkaliphilus serpentinus]